MLSAIAQPSAVPPLIQAIEQHQGLVKQLSERVDLLEMRLKPIMRPFPPSPETTPGIDKRPATSFTIERLNELSTTMLMTYSRLERILEHLDV